LTPQIIQVRTKNLFTSLAVCFPSVGWSKYQTTLKENEWGQICPHQFIFPLTPMLYLSLSLSLRTFSHSHTLSLPSFPPPKTVAVIGKLEIGGKDMLGRGGQRVVELGRGKRVIESN